MRQQHRVHVRVDQPEVAAQDVGQPVLQGDPGRGQGAAAEPGAEQRRRPRFDVRGIVRQSRERPGQHPDPFLGDQRGHRVRPWRVQGLDAVRQGVAPARRGHPRRETNGELGIVDHDPREGPLIAASALPFAGDVFDLVLSVDVVVHLPRGEEHHAARELARVTARGGLVVLRVSALDILRSRHSEFAFERQRFTRRP